MSLKVLHLPTSVGGNSWGLAEAERRLGLDSKVMIFQDDYLHYPHDINIHLEKYLSSRDKVNKLLDVLEDIKDKYDIFHFNYGTSLIDYGSLGMELYDLSIYPSKAKIFVTYNGCDARQKYETKKRVHYSACQYDDCYQGHCMDFQIEEKRKRMIKKFSLYANHMFALNPDLLYFLPEQSSFLPYTISNWDEVAGNNRSIALDKVLKIVHAPTNRVCKGSDIILKALERAKGKYGDQIEIKLVEGVSHIEALKIYHSADLIIDQILVGWYGAFAVETMRMGKPVMVFIREEDLKFLPRGMKRDVLNALINVDASSIYERLCELIENRSKLREYSNLVLDYVNTWHNPISVARTTMEFYYKSFCTNK